MVEWGIIEPNDTVESIGINNYDTIWVEDVMKAGCKVQFCPACLSYCKRWSVAQARRID